MKKNQSTSIKVACRLRPLNQLEMSTGGACCLTYSDKNIKVKVAGEENPYDFTFDHIFGPDSSQNVLYEKVAKPVLTGLMDGYNGTIFAYGQTSSGKTFTMEGPDIVDTEEKKGIIPRMMSHLFELILNSSENIEFNVKVSFLELYNEKLHDLLDPRKMNLQIKEDKVKGIFVQDITEIYVSSAEQMRQVHKKGSENKTIAATRMNERSSRSHSVFILNLTQKDITTEAVKHSKLYFVDLAGSEKIAKTHVVGQQLEEAKNINKSLSALGLVINALTEKKENVHVPYRDSKLTRLLQESLGGNSQTSLILACSMCSYNDKETLSTLRFGNRAKNIKNTPTVNAERSAKELLILLDIAEKKIKDQEGLIDNLQVQLDRVAGGEAINISIQSPNTPSNKSQLKTKQITLGPEETEGSDTTKDSKSSKNTGQGSQALTLLKQQIQISNLGEEIQDLKQNKTDMENEIANKNQEIYDLNGKIMHYEHQLTELTTKNLETLQSFRLKFDKIANEKQENENVMSKFLRAMTRLKSDLHFMYISKNLRMLDIAEKNVGKDVSKETHESQAQKEHQLNKEDLIVNSIQKTIETLESIERDILENDHRASSVKDTENLIEALLKDSQPVTTSESSIQNITLSPTHGRPSVPNDLFVQNTEEELKQTLGTAESSVEAKGSLDDVDSLKADIEMQESFEDLTQRLEAMNNDESRITELQNLVTVQRKTITNLSKLNAELESMTQKLKTGQEKESEGFTQKFDVLEKSYAEKTKEYDQKMKALKVLMEERMKEVEEARLKQNKDLLDKTKQISDLKYQNDRMQKIILGTDLPKRILELENKLKEVALERQSLFEEVFKLRSDVDEKDDLISDKNSVVQLLQSNINTLSTELEILKHFRPQPTQGLVIKKRDKNSLGVSREESKTSQWVKEHMVQAERHVIKPIRGGGGNVKNFERDNFLVFEKPSVLGPSNLSMQTSGLRGSRRSSRDQKLTLDDRSYEGSYDASTAPKSTTAEKDRNKGSKKLDDLLNSGKLRRSTTNGDKIPKLLMKHNSFFDKDDNTNRTLEDKNPDSLREGKEEKDEAGGQSSLKHILSNVKSFFS